MIPLNGVCMMVIPSFWVCFSFIDVPLYGYVFHLLTSLFMGMFINLQHTHPGVDKSSQVTGPHIAIHTSLTLRGDKQHNAPPPPHTHKEGSLGIVRDLEYYYLYSFASRGHPPNGRGGVALLFYWFLYFRRPREPLMIEYFQGNCPLFFL